MWTVQVASLCLVERLYVRCGNLEVSWVKLLGGIEGLKICNYPWGRWKQATRLQRQFMIYLAGQRFPGAKDLFDNQPNAADPHKLHNSPLIFSILTNAREKASGDPRDKIFALCGLFRELEIPFPNPDYSKSIEDVYREAVVASIEYDRNIYILYHVPSKKDVNTWPHGFLIGQSKGLVKRTEGMGPYVAISLHRAPVRISSSFRRIRKSSFWPERSSTK